MQRTITSLLLITIFLNVGCNAIKQQTAGVNSLPVSDQAAISLPAQQGQQAQNSPRAVRHEQLKDVTSLTAIVAQPTPAQAIERKIIRNADLVIETDAPNNLQQSIAAVAEKHGGFVVTTEAKQNKPNTQGTPATVVNISVRVPAAQFGVVLDEIRKLNGSMPREKITGQDVTEEFIDLEARLRAKRALEAQFLEIMKRAQKVTDALEVQSQIADVRGEIERMEGRRRFLENQAALSTINVMLHTPAPLVAATTGGFWHGIKASFGDGLDAASHIIFGLVQFVIVLIPIALFILLPAWLLLRWLRRRVDWPRRTPAHASAANQE